MVRKATKKSSIVRKAFVATTKDESAPIDPTPIASVNDQQDEGDDSDDAPEAVSISHLKQQAIDDLKREKEALKSKKLETKAIQEQRQAKGREVNLEKEQKMVAAKSAKQAIDMSVFEEAERIAQSKEIESKEASKKRNHTVLETTEEFDTGVKRKTVKTRRVGGFTVVPIDVSLVKQKPVAKAVVDFRKGMVLGDRIKRRAGIINFHDQRE
ncbi:hypothetical protein HDU98_008265 [Podochytrium sp. JEL0797]|nr:hypothetical protein HDU98_008265 [Podochytrium sp. JEL0797]